MVQEAEHSGSNFKITTNPPPQKSPSYKNNTPNYKTQAGSDMASGPELKVVPGIWETDRRCHEHLIIALHSPHKHDGKENNSKGHQSVKGHLATVSNVSRNPHSTGPFATNHLEGNFLISVNSKVIISGILFFVLGEVIIPKHTTAQ